MRGATFPESGEAIAEAERIVAWLRVPVIALIALGQSLEHPNRETTAFAVTLACFSLWSLALLVWVYVRLARREEQAVRAEFGPTWDAYARVTPPFVPRLSRRGGVQETGRGGSAQ